jgi:hypothetical protein
MPSSHRLARRRIIEVSDLQDERVLLLRQGFGTREIFDGACRIAHVHTRIVLEPGDPHTLIAFAQAAQGIAIVPSTVWFSDQTIRVVPILHARESSSTPFTVLICQTAFTPVRYPTSTRTTGTTSARAIWRLEYYAASVNSSQSFVFIHYDPSVSELSLLLRTYRQDSPCAGCSAHR